MKVTSVNLVPGTRVPDEDRIPINRIALSLRNQCIRNDNITDEIRSNYAALQTNVITKFPQEFVTVTNGGVVGDRHFSADWITKVDNNWFNASTYAQVSILTKERYTELNAIYKKDIQAGQFGENIQIESSTPLEELCSGTILQFGDVAQIKITHLRTSCFKFINVLYPTVEEYFQWRKHVSHGEVSRIGVLGQVVQTGIIRPNDPIKVIHIPDKFSKLNYMKRPNGVFELTPCPAPNWYQPDAENKT